MKLQVIYNFYIADNECIDSVYTLHFYNLKKYSEYVDRMIFIITYDYNCNDDIVYKVKSTIIDKCNCNNLQIIFEKNDPINREGVIFKKYIIDRLDQYDDYLTFFGHTKGVSNQFGYDNLENLHKWINALYFLNFSYLQEVKKKLSSYNDTYDSSNNYITYGALYFKDYRHNNINNWFYSGSFYWINTYKMNKYIKDNNIDINGFICEENERLKRCAELFPGSILSSKYAAFHNDQIYNKEINHFNMYGWEISYKHIDLLIKQYLNVWEYEDFYNMHNSIINELSIKYN